jgi:hypothetical protein
MDCTIYCCKKNDNIYNLIYSNELNLLKSKESKNDWACSGYCDEEITSKQENMYQISTENVFRRVCEKCLKTMVIDCIFREHIDCIRKQIKLSKEKS